MSIHPEGQQAGTTDLGSIACSQRPTREVRVFLHTYNLTHANNERSGEISVELAKVWSTHQLRRGRCAIYTPVQCHVLLYSTVCWWYSYDRRPRQCADWMPTRDVRVLLGT